jgi:hypothetical protein
MKQITLVILALHAEDGNKLRLRKVWNSGLPACIIQAPLLCVQKEKEKMLRIGIEPMTLALLAPRSTD